MFSFTMPDSFESTTCNFWRCNIDILNVEKHFQSSHLMVKESKIFVATYVLSVKILFAYSLLAVSFFYWDKYAAAFLLYTYPIARFVT